MRITLHFSSEIMQARRKCTEIYKVWSEKITLKLEFCI